MKSEFERIIEEYQEREREKRNAELNARLAEGRSFEELLAELSCMCGLKEAERELVLA